jgi:hypothetical protein
VHIYDLALSVEGLPPLESAAGQRAWMAWVTTPVFHPVDPARPRRRRRHSAGPRIALNEFLVMISAEPDDDAAERTGPLLLRGTSPSMRMLPLDDPVLLMGAATPHDDDDGGAHAITARTVPTPT